MTMKKRIIIIAAAVIMMLAMASCSMPTQTHEMGDISMELPIHYVSIDEMLEDNATIQEILDEYVPENISVDAHIYASPVDATIVAVSNATINGAEIDQTAYEMAEGMRDSLSANAEIVEMGGTYGVAYTLDDAYGDQIPEALRGMVVVNLFYVGVNDCTTVFIVCPQDKYDAGHAYTMADSIVVD